MLVGIVFYKMNFKENDNKSDSIVLTSEDIDYDVETGLYYIKNEETGEIIGAGGSEGELQIYLDNPDFNPNPINVKHYDIKDFLINNEDESNNNE